jgi:hypothetical protein
MKRLIPLFIIILLSSGLRAQNERDALRFSQVLPGGTARSVALSGAFGALGGDFSSASQNPAGLGVYRNSEISFTPELYYNLVDARYNGETSQNRTYNPNFNHFSYVQAFKFRNSDIEGGSFAFGYNTLYDYSSSISIEGNNSVSSIVDQYIESANTDGIEPYDLDPYSEKLFFDGYIMDIADNGRYYLSTDIRDADGNQNIYQVDVINRTGKLNEWLFSAGFNYKHLLYFGASFAMNPLEYRETSAFSEADGVNHYDEYFNFTRTQVVEGMGYSGKFGIIVKPVNMLRIGLAYHLPVVYSMTRSYYAYLESNQEGIIYPIDEEGWELGSEYLDYTLKTPGKAVGSVGLLLGKMFLFTTDVELIDYAGMRFSHASDGYVYTEENNTISDVYSLAVNSKSGLEMHINNFYLRGGFAYFSSPYKTSETRYEGNKLNYSGGLGFKTKRFYIDFAVSYLTGEKIQPLYYSQNSTEPVSAALSVDAVKAMTTIGFRF